MVEQFISKKVRGGNLPMPVHLSIGQETVSVAVCASLEKQDYIWGTYRSHGLYIARTLDLKGLFSEILGRQDGCNSGRGGSMHLFSKEHRLLGTSGIVGSHIPNAVGFAYAMKQKGEKSVTCVVFGDGATDAGTFYDSINIAMLRKSPVLFLLEDNDLAIRTNAKSRQYNQDVLSKASAFGISVTESGSNLADMMRNIKLARARILDTATPELIRVKTKRWYQHLGFEYELNQTYRDFEHEKDILALDEVNNWLESLDKTELEKIELDISMQIDSAWTQAQSSAYPAQASIFDHTR